MTEATSHAAIGEWATAQDQAVLDCLGSESTLPCESTLRRCLQGSDAAALDAAVAGWAGEQLAAEQGRLLAGTGQQLLPANAALHGSW